MKLKNLAIVTGVLAVLALGGVLVQRQFQAPAVQERVGKALLSELDMSTAASMTVGAGENKVTLSLKDGTWIVAEQDGFPASEEKIRRFLVKLSGEIIQHKVTENPKKLAALGLLSLGENEDKFEKDKTAIRFAIADGGGKPLFELLIGNDRRGKTQDLRAASVPAGQYVRFPPAQVAYLIAEPLFIDTDPEDWLRAKVFSFDDDKLVKSMRVSVPGAKDLVFTRKDEKSDWALEGVAAAGMDKQEAELLARRLRDLEIIKVAGKAATPKELGREKVGVISFELFDKRSYRVEVGTKKAEDDYRFISVSGALDPTVTEQELKKDIRQLNGLFAKRIVAIYNWEGEQLLKKRKDFIEEKKK